MERKRRIEDDREKRRIGKKRESLFDEALDCLKSDGRINGVLPSGRVRHVVVVHKVYKSFSMYPTGCNLARLKEHQKKYPNRIFVPVRLGEPVGELAEEIFSAIDGNGRNSN